MNPSTVLNAFHFLRPLWLLALPIAWGLVIWLARRRHRNGDWSDFIDAELLSALRLDKHNDNNNSVDSGMRPWPWLALVWSFAILALAGPSWQRDSVPAYRAPAAWVVVLDLSPSMAASDLAPNRTARARYAIDDVLAAAHDARVALVAFSDEPYTVTPLTRDVATVRTLLPSLSPDMMPSPGDHLTPALDQAGQLLKLAGVKDRRIVVVTDGFDDPAASFAAAAALRKQGVTINVVGVGTSGGAPLRNADGHFSQDAQGQAVMAHLDVEQLRQLATAGGGSYADTENMPSLIGKLQASSQNVTDAIAEKDVEVAHWRDAGALLLPVLLLLAAVMTRKGWL